MSQRGQGRRARVRDHPSRRARVGDHLAVNAEASELRQHPIQPVLAPDDTLVGLQGPERALARYNARMATLQPKPMHRPKRSVRRRVAKQGGTR